MPLESARGAISESTRIRKRCWTIRSWRWMQRAISSLAGRITTRMEVITESMLNVSSPQERLQGPNSRSTLILWEGRITSPLHAIQPATLSSPGKAIFKTEVATASMLSVIRCQLRSTALRSARRIQRPRWKTRPTSSRQPISDSRIPTMRPANTLLSVKITKLPLVGSLKDNGVAVAAGAHVTVADITAGKLKFTPAANKNGTAYASFTFQVEDNGGTANGGVDTDPTAKTMTIAVTSVNDAPVGTAKTVTTLEDTAYVFKTTDFGLTDPNDSPPNTLLAVKFTSLPLVGSLTDNGMAVAAGAHVAVADITAGKLKFVPAANKNGTAYASFTFQVEDNGGTTNGGVDTDPTAKKMTIAVTLVNDAPVGTAKTVTTLEDTAYIFKTTDFGFTDPNDSPPNTLLAVKITTLPLVGSLTDNGVAVAAGAHIAVADITAGKLKFSPAANKNGTAYASFTFQVEDNGGTASGGVDTDPTGKKMTIAVTAVNDAPIGASKTVSTLKNTAYVFKLTDFGFTDPNDTPPNTLLAIKIQSVPLVGTLTDNGGPALMVGATVSEADIAAGKLKFTPATNATGAAYATFTFRVQDNGGTATGGVDTDPFARTMTISVT